MSKAFIGIGTNLGDRLNNINLAHSLLEQNFIRIVCQSVIEETVPVDFTDQPDFLNQIIIVETEVSPVDLFNTLQLVEKKMKREKTIEKGPRIIDLDLLLYDDIILNNEFLTVPHKAIHNRDFILKQLIELDENLVCPECGKKYKDIYNDEHK